MTKLKFAWVAGIIDALHANFEHVYLILLIFFIFSVISISMVYLFSNIAIGLMKS